MGESGLERNQESRGSPGELQSIRPAQGCVAPVCFCFGGRHKGARVHRVEWTIPKSTNAILESAIQWIMAGASVLLGFS